MFTGIIKEVGIIKSITENQGSKTFVVEAPTTVQGKKIGDSIAIDGACHTVTSLTDKDFTFDSIPETLKLTNFNEKKEGDEVNLEPAMQLKETLDGHIVTGHIDTTAKVVSIKEEGDSKVLTIEMPPQIAKYIALKGSICINGTSLTISNISESAPTNQTFSVSLIPHTWQNTALKNLQPNSKVNLEIDPLTRYLERLLQFSNKKPN